MSKRRLSIKSKISYGFGEAGEAFSWSYASMYLMYFWTDVLGIHMSTTGVILLVSRLWDGITDALIGNWADRTKTPIGSFRPWILASCFPLAIINIACFTMLPMENELLKFACALALFMLFIFFYSCENVPQNAMMAAMTLDSQERVSLATYRTILGYGGTIIVSNLALRSVDVLGAGNDAKGFFFTTIIFSGIMVVLLLLCVSGTRETVPVKPQKKIDLRDIVLVFRGNTPVIVLSVAEIALGLFMYSRSAVAVYYFTYIAGDRTLHGIWTTVQLIGSILGTLLVPALSNRMKNKAFISMLGWGMSGCLMLILGLLEPARRMELIIFFGLQLIIGIGFGMATTSIYSIIPDVTEYTQKLKGRRMSGTIAAVISFFNKCGMAFGSAGAAWILSLLGYQPNVEQNSEVLLGIRVMFTFAPGVLALGCVYVMSLYRIDRQTHNDLITELYGEEH